MSTPRWITARRAVELFALVMVMIACFQWPIGQALAQDDNLKQRAETSIRNLNDYSRYSSSTIRWASADLKRLNALADKINGMDPAGQYYRAWVDHYNHEREVYAAHRANQENAMIRFRDAVAVASRLLRDEQGRLRNLGLEEKLRRALDTGQKWVNHHDFAWADREQRGNQLITAGVGAPEGFGGIQVLVTETYEAPPDVVDVDEWYPIATRFTNNSDKWLHVEAKVVTSGPFVQISPAKPYSFWIEPLSTTDGSWSVKVTRGDVAYEATVVSRITGYSPYP